MQRRERKGRGTAGGSLITSLGRLTPIEAPGPDCGQERLAVLRGFLRSSQGFLRPPWFAVPMTVDPDRKEAAMKLLKSKPVLATAAVLALVGGGGAAIAAGSSTSSGNGFFAAVASHP